MKWILTHHTLRCKLHLLLLLLLFCFLVRYWITIIVKLEKYESSQCAKERHIPWLDLTEIIWNFFLKNKINHTICNRSKLGRGRWKERKKNIDSCYINLHLITFRFISYIPWYVYAYICMRCQYILFALFSS